MPAAFCLWSLLSFYHIGNNMILMLPAFVFLWFADDPPTAVKRRVLALLIQLELMVDVPVRFRAFVPLSGWGRLVIVDFDRFLVALTFAYVIALWYRLRNVPCSLESGREVELENPPGTRTLERPREIELADRVAEQVDA